MPRDTFRSARSEVFGGGRFSRRRGQVFPASALDEAIMILLAQAVVPLSAYDLVELLRQQGRRVVAMSVYRSLDRLCARDMIHKVEMLSAYRIRDVKQPVLMICIGCGSALPFAAAELHQILSERLAREGFTPSRIAFEVAGLCTQCQADKS